MKSGLKLLVADHRDRKYDLYKHYGAVKADLLPTNESWDAGLTMPDQNADNAPTECTGYTQTDNEMDLTKEFYTPDFSYAAGIEAEGVVPNTNGCDLRASLQGVINRGVLPIKYASISASLQSELYVANMTNWTNVAAKALGHTENSYRAITTGPHDIFGNIRNGIHLAKKGASAGSPWYQEFNATEADGIMKDFDVYGEHGLHNYAIKGTTTKNSTGHLIRNGEVFLKVKSWQGKDFGDKGWLYMSQAVCNKLFGGYSAEVYVLTKDGNRMWNIFVWLAGRFPALIFYLPKLYKLVNDAGIQHQTPRGTALYEAARVALGTIVAPLNEADGYGAFGCAITLNTLAQKAWGKPIGGGYSTALMLQALNDRTRFASIVRGSELPGDIIIAATGTSRISSALHGHVGCIAKYGILGNNSEDGRLEENYTIESWYSHFAVANGFPIYIFRPL